MIREFFVFVPLCNPTGAFLSVTPMLNSPEINLQLHQAVDEFCCREFEKGPRGHLGASEIGRECARAIWLKFRFCDYTAHTGRMHRLFQRGHEEEPRLKRWLEGIGCVFQDSGETQLGFKALGGHYSGSCDGVLTLPEWTGYNLPILWENKTYGGEAEDKKYFSKLFEIGVKEVKPEHYTQMQVYMGAFNLQWALYTAVQKSTDEIYYEFVECNPAAGFMAEEKAKSIIYSQQVPQKISNRGSSDFRCRFCDFKEICHLGKEILTNCRSCVNCKPIDNASWECSIHGIVPKHITLDLHVDCESWQPIFRG